MGRPTKEKKLSNAERKRRYREIHGEEKKAKAREKYHEKKIKMGEIELDQLREKNRIKKIKSRENQQLNWSRQKKEGTKIKERNRKKLSKITSMTPDSHITAVSTERVHKHREKLKVKMDFKTKMTRLTKREIYSKGVVKNKLAFIKSAENKASIIIVHEIGPIFLNLSFNQIELAY